MTDAGDARIEAEVKSIVLNLYDSVARGELSVWMDAVHEESGLWAVGLDVGNFRKTGEDFVTFWTSDDPTRTVRQEIEDMKVSVVVVSPTVAFAAVTSPNRRWFLANGEVNRIASAETWVLVLTDGGWKLHSGQSALFPLEE